MRIIKLTFIEDAGLNDQFIHGYEFGAKNADVDRFIKSSEGTTRYTPTMVAGAAGSILRPTADRERLIRSQVAGGWDQGRLMFAMVIEVSDDGISKEYQYITGYTDRKNFRGGNGRRVEFDSDMRMYFNTNTRVHMTESTHGIGRDRGRVWQPKLMSHDQILRKSALVGESGVNRDVLPTTTRPQDLFKRAGGDSAFGEHLSRTSLHHENTVGRFTSAMKASTRVNNTSSSMLSRSLNAYISSDSDPGAAYSGDSDQEDVIVDASHAVSENDLSIDPVLQAWAHDSNIFRTGYILYSELLDQQVDFDEDRMVGLLELGDRIKGDEAYRNRPGRENQSHWDDGGNEPLIAKIIAMSLPSMMLTSMFSSVKDLLINTRARTALGDRMVNCITAYPYIDTFRVASTLDYFEDQVEFILLKELTQGGRIDIEARIHANIDTDIEIYLSIDGAEEQYFCFPVYMDGLLAPTLSTGMEDIDELTKGIVDLSAAASRSRHRSNPVHLNDEPIIKLDTDLSSARRDRDGGNSRGHTAATPTLDLTGVRVKRPVRDY